MSRQNDIEDAIWADPDFHVLSPPAKLVYLWSFTNSRVGMAGLYKVPQATIEHETGHRADEAADALAELQSKAFLFYDGTWLWVRKRISKLRTRTVQMCRSVAKQVGEAPEDHPFRVAILHLEGDRFWASKDVRTTLTAEVGGFGVPSGSDPGFTAPRRNSGYHPRATGVAQGQGQGKGKGPSREGVQGEGRNWRAYAAEHLPELPEAIVCMTAIRLAGGGHEFTPEELRNHVLTAHPYLAEEAA